MTVRVEGFEQLAKKITDLESMEAVKTGLEAGALHLKNQVEIYPPRRLGAPAEFVSDRQRRFFFAALKDGRIEVPYRRGQSPRSERHDKSWTVKTKNKGLTKIIGSDTSYGQYLQDERRQTRMHKLTGWKTTKRIADHEGPKVLRLVIKEVDKLLSR